MTAQNISDQKITQKQSVPLTRNAYQVNQPKIHVVALLIPLAGATITLPMTWLKNKAQ